MNNENINLSLMQKALWIAGTKTSSIHSLTDLENAGFSFTPDEINTLWEYVQWLRMEIYK